MLTKEELESIKHDFITTIGAPSVTFLKGAVKGLLSHVEELEKKIKEFEEKHK